MQLQENSSGQRSSEKRSEKFTRTRLKEILEGNDVTGDINYAKDNFDFYLGCVCFFISLLPSELFWLTRSQQLLDRLTYYQFF